MRLNVRHEIKSLQKRLGFTSLIVTHDQQEALVMADRIAVLNQGRIEQTGTPEEIYQRPATPFVADFMGADNKIISGELSAAAISGLSAAQQGAAMTACCWRMPRSAGRQKAAFGSMCQRRPCIFFLYHYHSDISVFILGTIHVD